MKREFHPKTKNPTTIHKPSTPRLPCVKGAGAKRLRDCCHKFATAGCLRRPYLFRLVGKDRGEKGRLGYVWCFLPLNSGEHQYFRRRSTWKSPYGRLGTRRLIRGYQICSWLPQNHCYKWKVQFESVRLRLLRGSFSVFAGTPCLLPGEGMGMRTPHGFPYEGKLSAVG